MPSVGDTNELLPSMNVPKMLRIITTSVLTSYRASPIAIPTDMDVIVKISLTDLGAGLPE